MIYHLCESKRAGLHAHVLALAETLKDRSLNSETYIRHANQSILVWGLHAFLLVINSKRNTVFHCFSIGPVTALLIAVLRCFRRPVWYYCHEPGTLNYLRLRKSTFLAVLIYLLNYFSCRLASLVLVGAPSIRFAYGRRVLFAPLPYREKPFLDRTNVHDPYAVGVLGTVSMERGLWELETLARNFKVYVFANAKIRIPAIPNVTVRRECPFSEADKEEFLSGVRAVINLRSEPYYQSGVTADCLVHGLPVLTSQYDLYVKHYFSDLLPQVDLAKVNGDSLTKYVFEILGISERQRMTLYRRGRHLFVERAAKIYARAYYHSVAP